MSSGPLLQFAFLAIAVVLVTMSAAIAVRRLTRRYFDARLEKRLAVMRPRLLRMLSADEPDLSMLEVMRGSNGRLLETVTWSLLPKVRGASRTALVESLQRRGAIERARRRTHKRGAVGRAKAAEHLGAAGLEVAYDDLARLLQDRHGEVRIVAVRALGKLGDPRAVPALLDTLEGPRTVPMGIISMSIVHMGPSVIDELIVGLSRSNPEARTVCAELLGLHGAFQAARRLAQLLLADPAVTVRVSAAHALGRLGAPQGVEALARAIAESESPSLRRAAVTALGRIGGRDALGALQIALRDEDGRVADAAAEALSLMGDPGTEVLSLAAGGDDATAGRAHDWLQRTLISGMNRRRGRSGTTQEIQPS